MDLQKLATMVRNKRGNRGLREVSKEIGGVSPSTISRVENEKMPDMDTFLKLCDWLQVSVTEFIHDDNATGPSTTPSENIEIQLRADKNLDPATANALAAIVRAAYRELAQRPEQE
jgi:transcriptional regulator with XRE-family HTH domain